MCGRYNNHLEKMHGWADLLAEWPNTHTNLSYNVAPTNSTLIIATDDLHWARWGLVPSWANEFRNKYNTINARIETAATRTTYKNAWQASRTCLVPAAGYYEWSKQNEPTQKKQPYYIYKPNDSLMLAGLWEPWHDQISFTILTEPPKGALATIHNRMPVMLSPESAKQWLSSGTAFNHSDERVYTQVKFHPVGSAVNNARNDEAELIEPIKNLRV